MTPPRDRTGEEVLALIPARGGSKGIPRKNLAVLGGRPLIAWTIESARNTPEIDQVVVSTDDEEIADVSRSWGADVVMRPPELGGDTASSESAILHALDVLRDRRRYEPDLVVFLQATSPLRRADDISKAIARLVAEQADSLLSVSEVHAFLWRREGNAWRSFNYDYRNRKRRQDSPEDVIENGSIYIFRPRLLRESGNRLGGRIAVYPMDPLDSFQIDCTEDLALVERLLESRTPRAVADLAALRLLVLDFDGVMTDDRVLVDENGKEAVWCHRGDGMGIGLLREAGVEVLVLSKETNPVVSARCRKLGITAVQGCDDKLTALKALVAERSLQASEVGYIGNDVNDLACLRWVGAGFAVADAVPEAKRAARYVSSRPGGWGAVREICDRLVASRSVGAPLLEPIKGE